MSNEHVNDGMFSSIHVLVKYMVKILQYSIQYNMYSTCQVLLNVIVSCCTLFRHQQCILVGNTVMSLKEVFEQ